jgi:hypothetical protein
MYFSMDARIRITPILQQGSSPTYCQKYHLISTTISPVSKYRLRNKEQQEYIYGNRSKYHIYIHFNVQCVDWKILRKISRYWILKK